MRIKADTVTPLMCKDDGRESSFPVGIKFKNKAEEIGQIPFESVISAEEVEDTGIKLYTANQDLTSRLIMIAVSLFVASLLFNMLTGYFGFHVISNLLNPVAIICYLILIVCLIDSLREEFAPTKHKFNIKTRDELYEIYIYPSSESELEKLKKVREYYSKYLNRTPKSEAENTGRKSEETISRAIEADRINNILSSILDSGDVINSSMKQNLKLALDKLDKDVLKPKLDVLEKLSSGVKERIEKAFQEGDVNQKAQLLSEAIERLKEIKHVASKLPVNQAIWNLRLNELIAELSDAIRIKSK